MGGSYVCVWFGVTALDAAYTTLSNKLYYGVLYVPLKIFPGGWVALGT